MRIDANLSGAVSFVNVDKGGVFQFLGATYQKVYIQGSGSNAINLATGNSAVFSDVTKVTPFPLAVLALYPGEKS